MRPSAADFGNVTLLSARITCPIFTAATSIRVLFTAVVTCRCGTERLGTSCNFQCTYVRPSIRILYTWLGAYWLLDMHTATIRNDHLPYKST